MDFPYDQGKQDQNGPDAEQPLMGEDQESGNAEKVAEKLQIFGARLAQRRDDWVAARVAAGCDSRWADDLDQFNGRDVANRGGNGLMASLSQGEAGPGRAVGANRSTVFVQVTRQKTNAAAARLGDILLPTDERNFSVGPTVVPALPEGARTPGSPAPQAPGTPPGMAPTQGTMGGAPAQMDPAAQAAQQLVSNQAKAKIASDAMQAEIEDALAECDYNAEVRKVIFDAALFGTGVLKGPVVVNRTRKAWQRRTDLSGAETWVLDVVDELSPASFRVDPRNIYPDPACGDNVQNGRGLFEVNQLTPKQLRELVKQPAYMRDQLLAVVEEGPQVSKKRSTLNTAEDTDTAQDEVFEHWIYWGEIDREDLEVAGVDIGDDELEVVSACVEMVNSTVVRAYLNPLAGGVLPYDMFPWEQTAASVWGYGVPYLMRSQQRVINAAWRMILDNAGVSSGPQIVMKPGLISPADKKWELASRKIWYATDDVDDVRKAFTTFEFNSHQAELQAIIDMAEKLSDAETAVPMLAQGEQGAAPETVGGMQMLMNSSNVVLKRLVKQFDDNITKPHIRRYYAYLMEYSTKEEIKGDFDVIALGSSSLVVRDIQNQSLTNLLGLATNPAYAPLINLKSLFTKVLKAEHIDPVDVMNSDEDIAKAQQAAQQNQQPDPRVAAAQLRSDADKIRTNAQVQMNLDMIHAKEINAREDRAMRLEVLKMERDIELLRVSQKENISVMQLKAQLATVAMKERAAADRQANDIHREGVAQMKQPVPQD